MEDRERNCKSCIWNTPDGCSSWSCEQMTRTEAREVIRQNKDLIARCNELVAENHMLRERIDAYIGEFRVCHFCKNIKEDCSPVGSVCKPAWRWA